MSAPDYCPRCRGRVNDWLSLPPVGVQVGGGEVLDLRNCRCGTTMSCILEGDAREAAIFREATSFLAKDEKELRVRALDGGFVLVDISRGEKVVAAGKGPTFAEALLEALP